MTKEEAVSKAIAGLIKCDTTGLAPAVASVFLSGFEEAARAAIAAADKWDAEQHRSEISAGQDSAIQEELDHPPASIMEEGK
jgi:hypothetical protein